MQQFLDSLHLNWGDGTILVIALVAGVIGWRRGAITSLLSTVGLLSGGVIGLAVAPWLMGQTDHAVLKAVFGFGAIILLALVGHSAASVVGGAVGNGLRSAWAIGIDRGLGAVLQVMATLVVVWMVAMPVASAAPGALAGALRESRILTTIDRIMPAEIGALPARLAGLLNDSNMPLVIDPFQGDREPMDTTPADPDAVDLPLVEQLRPSVIRVLGEAPSCNRLLQGTGFVIAPDTVITNAHVVAGTQTVRLDTVAGTADAAVVHYDPENDIAVLHSDSLPLGPLAWASEPAPAGTDTMVLGFPESGPFAAEAGRIADRMIVDGPNIYSTARVQRESYAVNGSIRQGNSGGPMVSLDGQVLGLVFGQSVDNRGLGYVLTADEVQQSLAEAMPGGAWAAVPVDTGACVR